MIDFEEAFDIVLSRAEILGVKRVPLTESIGCVLAEDIKSGFDIPQFYKSAMDGYAVISEDIVKAPVNLKCVGEISAGKIYNGRLNNGECVKIMTGSPVPEGADAVVMIENTSINFETKMVEVKKPVCKWENVCLKGESVKAGDVVLKKGTILMAPEVALIASTGKKEVMVYKKPEIAILSTGNELIEPGARYEYGKIYNSNGSMICALLLSVGMSPVYLGIATDDEKSLFDKINAGLQSDMLIISGGVSMGDYDLVPVMLKKCGVEKDFHKVAIKPGKPTFFGHLGRTLVFGLPGNPVSVFLNYSIFVKPAIDRIMGKRTSLKIDEGILISDFENKPGRKNFIPCFAKKVNNIYEVSPVRNYHGSGDIAGLLYANGFMIVERDITRLNKDTKVEVMLWRDR